MNQALSSFAFTQGSERNIDGADHRMLDQPNEKVQNESSREYRVAEEAGMRLQAHPVIFEVCDDTGCEVIDLTLPAECDSCDHPTTDNQLTQNDCSNNFKNQKVDPDYITEISTDNSPAIRGEPQKSEANGDLEFSSEFGRVC
ncbi:hypothetical protein QAD02_007196 [Eretmocerus hayati]|uniref:Uncharacterized protein n=1 Tax=Eretmocerus hayati TaxID=131215 RepID=A0ACC2N3B3_9HYME|nr:hypothetical protein QAD02_007196 [Eretmocerus hayati]